MRFPNTNAVAVLTIPEDPTTEKHYGPDVGTNQFPMQLQASDEDDFSVGGICGPPHPSR